MALHGGLLSDLALLKERGVVNGSGRIVEIGAQQLSNDFLRSSDHLSRLFGLFDRTAPDFGAPSWAGTVDGLERLADSAPASGPFWEALGYRYCAVDFDGYRDSIALDLNRDRVPRRLRGAFDLVVNTGTTEHIANQDNAFRAIHDFTRKDGIMYHMVPAGGMMCHGLLNYNLKFFWHLCRENAYEVLSLRMQAHGSSRVPREIIDSNRDFGRILDSNFAGEDDVIAEQRVPDCCVVAILRRINDDPFVTPMDVPADLMRSPRISLRQRVARWIF